MRLLGLAEHVRGGAEAVCVGARGLEEGGLRGHCRVTTDTRARSRTARKPAGVKPARARRARTHVQQLAEPAQRVRIREPAICERAQ